MSIADDFEVQADGDLRHVAGTTVYPILDLHSWLQNLADDASPTGDDNVSILGANPTKMDGPRDPLVATRLNLLNGVNIDDLTARFLHFGSIKQAGGNTLFSGLKTIGAMVAASPIYLVQSSTKLTKYWTDGHIQILVKVRDAGSLIDSGLVDVYSRKYGQSYSYFQADLSAGGESPAALGTEATSWTTLTESECEDLVPDITLTFGTISRDLGNGNGMRSYRGTITLSGGITPQEAAQVLQYMTREEASGTINSIPGWRYQKLHTAYVAEAKAPFGEVIGGKWYVAQGWWLDGSPNSDFVLKDDTGAAQTPPNLIAISIGNLVIGDRILVGKDNGAGWFDTDQYNVATGTSGATTLTVQEAIAADTPEEGILRIGGHRYTYTGFSGSDFTGVAPPLTQTYSAGTDCWTPYIDKAAEDTTETVQFLYSSTFTGRMEVRNGGGTPIQPFGTTFQVGAGGASANVVRNSDV